MGALRHTVPRRPTRSAHVLAALAHRRLRVSPTAAVVPIARGHRRDRVGVRRACTAPCKQDMRDDEGDDDACREQAQPKPKQSKRQSEPKTTSKSQANAKPKPTATPKPPVRISCPWRITERDADWLVELVGVEPREFESATKALAYVRRCEEQSAIDSEAIIIGTIEWVSTSRVGAQIVAAVTGGGA